LLRGICSDTSVDALSFSVRSTAFVLVAILVLALYRWLYKKNIQPTAQANVFWLEAGIYENTL
jgi:multidrug resistance efflux pump